VSLCSGFVFVSRNLLLDIKTMDFYFQTEVQIVEY